MEGTRAARARSAEEANAAARSATATPSDKYFDQVIAVLGHPEALLTLGPEEAKQQLADRIGQATTRPQPALTLETTDKLTDPQIVATVTKHFEKQGRR